MSSVQDEKIAEIDRKLAELDRPPVPDVQRHGVEISNDEYHQLPGVSASKLKDFIEDPRLYHYKHLSGEYVQESKSHFDFGQAVHDICLQGTQANIAVIPDEVLSKSGSKSGKAWDDWQAAHNGKLLLKQAEFDAVTRCVKAVESNPVASKLLAKPGPVEQMFQCRDDELGLMTRCKPDKIAGENTVVDLKTSKGRTTAKQFSKHAANFGYHYQNYFYTRTLKRLGYEIEHFVFIVVSVDQPHTVDCYKLDEEFLRYAATEVESALQALAKRTAENNWDTDSPLTELSPPNYLKYQGEYQV